MGYETLGVYQRALDLAVDARRFARTFPKFEFFALTPQVCSSGDSVPSNIAEAEGRSTRADKLRFLGYSLGSLFELETRLRIADRAGYNAPPKLFGVVDEVKNLLRSYIRYVERSKK